MKISTKFFDFHGILLFLGCLFFIFPSIVFANTDAIQERAYFIDHSKEVTIDNIAQQKFVNYSTQIISLGYLADPLWIRIKLNHSIQQKSVLRILPPYLDNIEIYQQVNHHWTVKTVGDVFSYDNNEFPVTAFAVAVSPNIDQSYIYIKLVTTSTSTVLTQVMTERELYRAENNRDILLSIYLGIVFMTLIYSIMFYLRFKENIIGYFSFMIASEFIFSFFIVGFGGHYLLANFGVAGNKITSYSIFLYAMSGLLFHRAFIKSEIKNKYIVNIISVIIVLDVIIFGLYNLGFEHIGLKFNALIIFCLAIILTKIPLDFIFKKVKICTAQFAIIYAIIGPGVVIGLLPFLGINSSTFWALYSNLFNGFFTSILLLKLLYDRSKKTESTLSQLAIENEKEKWANEQQKRLLSMLVHEIKSPLSVLKLTVDRQLKGSAVEEYANRAIYNIDELINRFVEFDKLDDNIIRVNKTEIDVNQLIYDVITNTTNSHRFTFSMNKGLIAFTDEAILRVILQNLIINALKYSPSDSIIDLSAIHQKDKIYFSILNEVGIAGAPDQDLVFKKYYRNPQASREAGTGLGLYVVNSLIELLNGHIQYENNNNKVKFTLWIPI